MFTRKQTTNVLISGFLSVLFARNFQKSTSRFFDLKIIVKDSEVTTVVLNQKANKKFDNF